MAPPLSQRGAMDAAPARVDVAFACDAESRIAA